MFQNNEEYYIAKEQSGSTQGVEDIRLRVATQIVSKEDKF